MIPEIARRCKETLLEHQKRLWNILLATLVFTLILGLARLAWLGDTASPIRIIDSGGPSQAALVASQDSPAGKATSGTYVASKSGTRYYLPHCAGASRIKEENKVWFATKAEAESRGLLPAANCKGI